MNKYDYEPDEGKWDANTFALYAVANELAEKNRLKKIELRYFVSAKGYKKDEISKIRKMIMGEMESLDLKENSE